jgi:hypothetical protein
MLNSAEVCCADHESLRGWSTAKVFTTVLGNSCALSSHGST